LRLAAGRGGYGKGRPPTSRDAKIGRLNDRRTPPRGMYPDATLAPSRWLPRLLACYKAPSSWIWSCMFWFPTRPWDFLVVVLSREDSAVCQASNTIYSKRIGRESREKERERETHTQRDGRGAFWIVGGRGGEEEMCDGWVGAFGGEYDLLVFVTMNC
jgi:hypothetical protein